MRFFLENDHAISDHDVVSAVLRYDLVPIPVTLELVVNAVPNVANMLDVGRMVTLANGIELVIVKAEQFIGNKILDGHRTGAIVVTAVLAGCERLIHVTTKAVNLKDASFNEIYRACGAKVSFSQDIKVGRFVCFKGQMATQRISWSLQKEASCIAYDIDSRSLQVCRIIDLLSQEPTIYDASAVQWLSHAHTDGDVATHHLSIDPNGTDIIGQTPMSGRMDYIPRCDAREINNLSRVLIVRGTIERAIDESLIAGRAVAINDNSYVVATSAIRYESGAFGGGSQLSIKSWLYNLGNGNQQRQIVDKTST